LHSIGAYQDIANCRRAKSGHLHDIANNPHHKSKVRHRLTTTFLRRRYCTLMFALYLHDHCVHARWSFKCFARSLYQLCTESYTRHAVYI